MKLNKSNKQALAVLKEVFPDSEISVNYDDYKELCEIRVTLASGKVLQIMGGQCSGRIELFFTAPPEKAKRFELSGAVIGLPIRELFEDKYEAENRKSVLESKIRNEDSTLEIKEVEVEI